MSVRAITLFRTLALPDQALLERIGRELGQVARENAVPPADKDFAPYESDSLADAVRLDEEAGLR